MNQGVIIGIVAFLLWGSVSSWWYVCKIKGLCEDPEPVAVVAAEVPEVAIAAAKPNEPLAEADTVAEIKQASVATPVPIALNFDGILFAKNSTEPMDFERLNSVTSIIQDTLKTQNGSMVIIGHTCDLGSEAYNNSLGLTRANNVAELLKASGLNIPYTVESAGESRPLNDNTNETEREMNRRVEIDIKSNPK